MKPKSALNRIQLFSIGGLLILVLVGVILFALYSLSGGQATINKLANAQDNKRASPEARVIGRQTFSPAPLPSSAAELGDPMRGPQYYGQEEPPPEWPLTDRYKRWCWSDIESAQGQYNFQPIDDEIAHARAVGYTFGWRIMPLTPDGGCLPSYLNGVDYNNPLYLASAQALIKALGLRYDSNPYVGLLDISFYGCYGEWNESCGPAPMTAANRQKLIDMQFRAFPHKRFLMLVDHADSLDYALSYARPLRTGIRVDCLGTDELGGARDTLNNDSLVRNQWKVAPFYFEYCNGPDFALSLQDIKRYHASLIGDGDNNINDFGSYSSNDQKLMMQNYRTSGYRFELNSLTIPQKIDSGATFDIISKWTNVNVAPAYWPWQVMFQLRTASGAIAWEGKSQLDLRKPFSDSSQGGDAHIAQDSFTLPNTLASSNYKICVQIIDPNKIYSPMALANVGRASDGSYCLGDVNV